MVIKKKLNEKQLKLLRELNTDEDLANLWRVLISDALDNALFEEVPVMEEVPKEVAPIVSAVSSIKRDNSYAGSIKNAPSGAASIRDPSVAGSIKKDPSYTGSIKKDGSNVSAMVRALSNISLTKKETQTDAASTRDIEAALSAVQRSSSAIQTSASGVQPSSSAVIQNDAEMATKLSMAELTSEKQKKKMSKKQKKQLDALAKENSASTLWRVMFSGTFLSVLCDDYRGVPLPNVASAASDISEASNASRALLQALSAQVAAESGVPVATEAAVEESTSAAIVAAKSNSSVLSRKSAQSTSAAIAATKSNSSVVSRKSAVSKSRSMSSNAEEPAQEATKSLSFSRSHTGTSGILKNSSRASALSQKEALVEALNNEEEFKELWETAVQETLPKMLEDEYDMAAKSYVDFHPEVKDAVHQAQSFKESNVDEEALVQQEADRGLELAQAEAAKKEAAALRITDVFKVNKAKKQKFRLKEKKVKETRQLKSISEAIERQQEEDEERQAADDKAVEIMDYKTRTVLMWSNQLTSEDAQGDDADNTEVVIVRKGKKKKRDKRGISSDSTLSRDTSKWSRGSTTVASASVAESETTGGRKYGLSKKTAARVKSRSRAE